MNESHTLLLDMQERFLAEDALARESGFAQRWRAAADLGLLLAPACDEAGGIGSDGDFRLAFFEQRGAHLALAEFGPTLAGAWTIIAATQREDLGEALGTGTMIAALPTIVADLETFSGAGCLTAHRSTEGGVSIEGALAIVRGAPNATHFIFPAVAGDEPLLVLVPRDQPTVDVNPFRLIDGSAAGRVEVRGAAAETLASGAAAVALWQSAVAEMVAAAAAEAVGVGRAMLQQTVDYVRQRKQFGQAIGSFQAVQHRAAEMLIEVEQARSLALAACRDRTDPFLVSAAKLRACAMLQMVADNAVQFHGGIGTTEELALSRYFRRAMALRGELGTAAVHHGRIERIVTERLALGQERCA